MATAFKDEFTAPWIQKDPDATLNYTINWAPWLAGDTIASVTWETPLGIVMGTVSHTASTATIWLSGGTAGQRYEITCAVTTVSGLVDERSFKVVVQDR